MDDEMIERCTEAAHDRSLDDDMKADFGLSRADAKQIAIAIIKAMREPTENMMHAKDKNGDEIHWDYSCNVCGGIKDAYKAMIDTITND